MHNESIIAGIFSDKEVHDLYPTFTEKVLQKLKDIGINIAEKEAELRIMVYVRNGASFKYYIGIGFGITLAEEELSKILDTILNVFKELGIKIDQVQYEALNKLDKEYLYTIPLCNLVTLRIKDINEFDKGIKSLNDILQVTSELIKYTLHGEISLMYNLVNKEYYIWVYLRIKPSLNPLREFLSLLSKYVNQGFEIDANIPMREKPRTDYDLLKFMSYYFNYVLEQLINSNLPIAERARYAIEYLNLVNDLINNNRLLYYICKILSSGEGVTPRDYVKLLDRVSTIIDILDPHQYKQLVEALNSGIPKILCKISEKLDINAVELLSRLISLINHVYMTSSKYKSELYVEERETYYESTSILTELYNRVISTLQDVIIRINPSKLIEYVNKQHSIHHTISTLVKYRMLHERSKFIRIEPVKLVNALEKLLFETYYYRIELKTPSMLVKLGINDKILVREYNDIFNKIDVRSHDKKYLNLLLEYYANELPEEFKFKALTIIYEAATKELESALDKSDYDKAIEILRDLPKIVSEKAINDIMWPRLNDYINKLLNKNVDKALELITNILNKLKWITRDSSLYLLKAKLQGKMAYIVKRYK